MITLYYSPNSCAMSEHIVLEWLGVPYEAVQVQIGSDEYRKIAPKWAVPAMRDGNGEVMTQNDALLKYLVKKYPDADLWSDGTIEWDYKLNNALAVVNGDLHPAFWSVFVPHLYTTETDDASIAAAKEASYARIERQMNYLNEHLADNKYMLGDKRSVADAYVFTVLRWSFMIPKTVMEYPNLKKFFDLMMEDESIQKIVKIHNPEK